MIVVTGHFTKKATVRRLEGDGELFSFLILGGCFFLGLLSGLLFASFGEASSELSRKFAGLNIYSRPVCQDCWAKFYCCGGCSASNLLVNGDIKIPNELGCQMQRKRLECAIAMKACMQKDE